MIGTSLPEYVFIRFCIFLLRAITPLALSYVVLFIVLLNPRTRQHRLPAVLETYLILESLFYLFVYLPLRARSQFPAVHPPLTSRDHRRALFDKCVKNIPDPEYFLRKWFLDAPLREIKRENVAEWIRWGFFSRQEAGLLHEDEIEEYVDRIAEATGRELEDGRGTAKAFRLTFDEVGMMHRCLAWYLIVFVVDCLTSGALLYAGYTFHRLPLGRQLATFPPRPIPLARNISPSKTISYWHKPHTSKTHLPILFIHGIGIGLYPYLPFLSSLGAQSQIDSTEQDGQIGILVLEILPISARLTPSTASMSHLVTSIHAILTHHAYTSFVLVANSYGTAITTNLLHSPLFNSPSLSTSAPRIHSMVLIDPVTFLLHLPSVAYNFTQRVPRQANEHQLYYFASMDMCVAHTLARHFFWTENILWREEVMDFGGRVCVSLAGRDLIVDTEEVWKYLTGQEQKDVEAEQGSEEWKEGKLMVLWFDGKDHAQVFDERRCWLRLEEVVVKYAREGVREQGALEEDRSEVMD